ncbi:MAG: hypothetical protein K2N23_04540 [Clostridia bacterium]|nr:hypothetical protein [Clostridia bacterium]
MIISFYDNKFKGLQNNASLIVDNASYSLILRGVDLDSLTCKCEAFTENIQPTFIVVKNDRGNYIYGCLAGIPQLNSSNQTEVTGSDLKTMLKSDVLLEFPKTFTSVNKYLQYVFDEWNKQVNQNSFKCELVFERGAANIPFDNLIPSGESFVAVNVWEDVFAPYLKFYALFMTGEVDLVNKKVVFHIGASMQIPMSIRLWELGVENYGKWIADVNETQGYVLNTSTGEIFTKEEDGKEIKWILNSKNQITNNPALRDIYPIKRKIVVKETDEENKVQSLIDEAAREALELLTDSMYNENIEIEGIQADFTTRFNIIVRRGEAVYKSLPCGELHYDSAGLKKVQIGYRFTGIQFLL